MSNHLASSQSLYLRKHAENPIDWWYWCDRALEIAKQKNKPIFLSIGYSSCHWCTVMEGEAFSDSTIAEYLNANFVPIKVDREERPDIDSIYMQALQMMTGQGGWPLNIWLNPQDLVPFYGGTYFPVQPKYGRPGFLEILRAIRSFYDKEPEKLAAFKAEIVGNLEKSAFLTQGETNKLTQDLLNQGINVNAAVLQPNDPGRPSFPMIPYAKLALHGSRFKQNYGYDPHALSTQRGINLALGGIYDHVGGGFHRYTVDHHWTVPHFEKMLYDNGQILEYLANLWANGVQQSAIERAIAGTVIWLQREMTHSQGYFYAAQDADNFSNSESIEPEEGDFYVWSYAELESQLSGTELAELQREFTVTPQGNFEGKNVLQRSGSEVSTTMEKVLDQLFVSRYGQPAAEVSTFPPAKNNHEAKTGQWRGRIPPVTDTKAIAAWNSLTISGLARAYAVFKKQTYLDLAVAGIEFILENQWLESRLQRLNYDGVATIPAQSEDYALLIKALLDLHNACPWESRWLREAIAVQAEFDRLLWSEDGGYYNNSADAGKELLVRERSYMDNATPAANGVAISNLVRLALLTDDLGYRDRAELTLRAFTSVMEETPTACPSIFVALDWFLHGTSVKTSQEQIEQLGKKYLPTTVWKWSANLADFPADALALVCHGAACLEPATSLEQIVTQIQSVA